MSDLILQPPPPAVRGVFNKDLLVNSYFEHTELFSPAANEYMRTGKYCGEVFNSKKYNIFWGREKERCKYGYTNPITKIEITGKHYFFLNYKQMKIIPPSEAGKKAAKRITAFPRFWPIHYFFCNDYEIAVKHGLNMSVLKPRGTGFSELLASFGAQEYTFQTEDPVFYFVAVERYLNKDGVLTKAWNQLDFLNQHTERAFKHVRQVKNQDLYKRASYISPENGSEIKTGGEIQGAVVDHPRKLRGARGFVNFEEGGSFPKLVESWITAKALAEEGGVKFAHMMVWGTGGEQGDGIMGLEDIFTNPARFECLPFDNCWEEVNQENDHGFFFPVWANMTLFMDKWGNTDFAKAKAHHDTIREKLQKGSNSLMDKHIAEYPYTPSEALMRLTGNPFPVEKIQRQLRLVDSSAEIKGILKQGELDIQDGKVKFILNPKLDPINHYPHRTDGILEGAFTMFEAPLKDEHGKVPNNLYYIVADCFAVDTEQATEWNSLGAYYVYKRANSVFPTEDDILVGWYAGRPPKVKDFHRRVFLAARFYNAVVQTEIKGGGQELLNYAISNGFLQYCGERPTVFNQDKDFRKTSGRQFFVRIEENTKPERIQKLVDWLLKERSLKVIGDEAQYVLNLEKIYDRALLQELLKYNPNGNFDRISCLLVLMTIQQEAELKVVEEQSRMNKDHIFSRQLYTDGFYSRNSQLSAREIMRAEGRSNEMII